MIIIGVTGTLGSGKGEVVEYFKDKGFSHFSARDLIVEEVERRGMPVNRDNTTIVANDLRKTHSAGYLLEELYRRAVEKGGNSVLESVRAVGELDFLRAQAKGSGESKKSDSVTFYLVSIDADPKARYERIVKRKSALDHVTFDKFLSDEAREMNQADPSKGNIAECMRRADVKVINNGTLADLRAQLEKAFTGRDFRPN